MKRILCIVLTCLCLIGMMPVQANALNVQQISPEEIKSAPVVEYDFSKYTQLPMFSGISTMDVGDNEFDEAEPNDTLADANQIAHDYTVYASLSESDVVDIYTITLTADSEVILVSLSTVDSLFWGIFDVQGQVIASSQEIEGAGNYYADGIGVNIAPGTYYFAAADENAGALEYMFYIEVHPHTYTTVVTEPTCTQDGYTTYTCACGFTYDDLIIPATGHTYTDDADTTCDQCGYVRGSDSGEDTDPQEFPFSEREWEVLKLSNQARLAEGVAPLTGFAKLQQAASIRADEITQSFSHIRPDGTSCFTIADEVGLGYYSMGENIASGQTTPEWVVDSWMNSSGHRTNILNAGFTHLGVGEVSNRWVQLFLGGGGNYTSISVVPSEASVAAGTSIDDMDLVAVLEHTVYGTCYLPVDASYCQGYNPQVSGTQTVTISVLEITGTFNITVRDHDHIWVDATCTAPKTCSVCGATEGEPLEHTWADATCTAPKTCTVCGATEGEALGHTWEDATCTAPKTCTVCAVTEGEKLGHEYVDGICANCGHDENEPEEVPMYRLYNPYTYEHLLTADPAERDLLVSAGWSLDGIAWNSPTEGAPVYRLYNPYDDWHTYTMNQAEIDMLVPLGWQVDGVVCRSATKEDGKPVYRLFNPYEQKNYHLLTASEDERDMLLALGWTLDGVAWFCLAD